MKKLMKTLAVLSVIGTMAMSMGITASAVDDTPISKDSTSGFAYDGNTVTSTESVDSFKLTKDYDSVNPTLKDNTVSETNKPNSNSPADTFKYTITPYAVWNAGSTYNGTNHTGTATKITKDNMPMLYATTDNSAKFKATPSGINTITDGTDTTRQLVIEQSVAIGAAKYSETASETHTAENTVDASATIKLPTYETVGDYWYQVVEDHGATTGVLYGTNDKEEEDTTAVNGAHTATYYIHVQVTETNQENGYDSALVHSVTMHTTAPTGANDAEYNSKSGDNYNQDNKVNAIENKYYAGDLVIKKEVTGNAGDKDEYFEVTVTFTKPAGTIVNSDIPFTAFLKTTANNVDTYTSTSCKINGQYAPINDDNNQSLKSDSNIFWNKGAGKTEEATATVTFYVKDGDSVTFSNIPYGINYEIIEKKPENDIYKNEIKFTNSKDDENPKFDNSELTSDTDSAASSDDFTKTAKGSVSDPRDEVTIINDKTTTIDIGVVLSNAPFIAMLGVAGAASYFVIRRKKRIEE